MKLKIKEICREKGITQKELAAIMGVSEVGLSQSVNGNPTVSTLEKIATALNVSITDLFEQSDNDRSFCSKCGSREFELIDKKENSNSLIIMQCANCKSIIGMQIDDNPNESDSVMIKMGKYYGGAFEVVKFS